MAELICSFPFPPSKWGGGGGMWHVSVTCKRKLLFHALFVFCFSFSLCFAISSSFFFLFFVHDWKQRVLISLLGYFRLPVVKSFIRFQYFFSSVRSPLLPATHIYFFTFSFTFSSLISKFSSYLTFFFICVIFTTVQYACLYCYYLFFYFLLINYKFFIIFLINRLSSVLHSLLHKTHIFL